MSKNDDMKAALVASGAAAITGLALYKMIGSSGNGVKPSAKTATKPSAARAAPAKASADAAPVRDRKKFRYYPEDFAALLTSPQVRWLSLSHTSYQPTNLSSPTFTSFAHSTWTFTLTSRR